MLTIGVKKPSLFLLMENKIFLEYCFKKYFLSYQISIFLSFISYCRCEVKTITKVVIVPQNVNGCVQQMLASLVGEKL
jgi:hypothetical protein